MRCTGHHAAHSGPGRVRTPSRHRRRPKRSVGRCRRDPRADDVKPEKPIRRFDVFAEYRMLDAHEDGMKADQARGYGLWVAKVVAARKFGRLKGDRKPSEQEAARRRRRKWKVLSGVPQTDKLFDHE